MELQKAYAITDAKISYVSLVDKAANKRKFLITKAEDGKATFTTIGRIVKKDGDNHFVTGIVYEPMTTDAHDNYMTEEEITKAAYFFMKNGGKVDVQHSFEPLEGAAIVESWIEKADTEIEGEKIQKGTWLMTMEITDAATWEAIEKGEITGFSMGGVGMYSDEDVEIAGVEKDSEPQTKKGLFKRFAEMMGFEVVEKGKMTEQYNEARKESGFWQAFDALERALAMRDPMMNKTYYEEDESKIREALEEFSAIITGLLASEQPVTKAIGARPQPVEKAGRKISSVNREMLQGAYETLGALLEATEPPAGKKPEEDDEDQEQTDDAASEAKTDQETDEEDDGADKTGGGNPQEDEEKKEEQEVTKAEVESMIQDAINGLNESEAEKPVEKQEQQPEALTREDVQDMINKALEPVLKARGVPTAMNSGAEKQASGQEQHYLHGII